MAEPDPLAALQTAFDRASQGYCSRYGFERDRDWIFLKLLEESGELTQAWNRYTGRGRPKGRSEGELRQDLEDELADLLGMVLILARTEDVDLLSAIQRKWRFDPRALPEGQREDG